MTRHPTTKALFLAITFAIALAALLPAAASARTTRAYQSSFGVFTGGSPDVLAVDQSNGDVYATDDISEKIHTVNRFDSSGAPKNFTAGPDAGTNKLTGFSNPRGIAVDNSGGPLGGTIYVTDGNLVKAYAPSGASLGSLNGSGTAVGSFSGPCGVAVDQSDGSLYVNSSLGRIWRYAPASPAGAIDDADYTVTGIQKTGETCSLAADSGSVYAVISNEVGSPIYRFDAADFAATPPQADFSVFASNTAAVAVDPGTGEVYVKHRDRTAVSVYDPGGLLLYEFGYAAYYGGAPKGIAVRAEAPGPAAAAYVTDPDDAEVDVFGPLTKVPTYTHPEIARFGPDGSAASSFGVGVLSRLAFSDSGRALYALDAGVPGIYGFDASAPPALVPLGAFDPLATAFFQEAGLAVDNTALGSAGNLYLAPGVLQSGANDLIYGFDSAGAPLGGAFPIDPAATPGAPDGSPKFLCGAAVDSAGNVWVSNRENGRVLRYSPAGAYLGSLTTLAQGAPPCNLALDSEDNLYASLRFRGVWKFSAASGYSTASRVARGNPYVLAVDPSTDRLYVADNDNPCGAGFCDLTWIDEYDAAGNLLDEFAIAPGSYLGIAVDPTSHYLYVANFLKDRQIHAFAPGILLPEVRSTPASAIANTAATANGTVNTQGLALADCHFEYVSEAAFLASGFTDLSSGGTEPCVPDAGSVPLDLDEHPLSAALSGLTRNTTYRFRLVAENANGEVTGTPLSFTTPGPPEVETVGSPTQATSAYLSGRVNPRGAPATYHFEYLDEAAYQANLAASEPPFAGATATPPRPAGAGNLIELVAERLEGLQPGATYRYRVVAENGNPDGPAFGAARSLTTREEDPLDHGDFPGPPGSDRAYEQVSLAETSGNPVAFQNGYSDAGDRALYGIAGGTPISEYGSLWSIYFAERRESAPHQGGWQSKVIIPPRSEGVGTSWAVSGASGDLSTVFAVNFTVENNLSTFAHWLLHPAAEPTRLFQTTSSHTSAPGFLLSADASRAVAELGGEGLDPAHQAAAVRPNLYDLNLSPPRLLSLMPDGSLADCGILEGSLDTYSPQSNWVSPDGELLFFPSQGDDCPGSPIDLYMREIDAGQTTLLSGPPLSGPACGAAFIKFTAGAAFFWTATRLAAEDMAPQGCGGSGGDIYRYEPAAAGLDCLTCLRPGLSADVAIASSGLQRIAVAPDGSRLYFSAGARLLPGAPADGAYRLNIASGELAYVGPAAVGELPVGGAGAITPDGSVLFFRSADPALNPLGGGPDNGGSAQYYRYDDTDRSLICVSCPPDGEAPAGAVPARLAGALGNNATPLSADGDTLAFATPTPLLGADQNTSGADPHRGTDLYEWRRGRLLLLTDGLTAWPRGVEPEVSAVSPSGADVFFAASTQYTPDALDGFRRLYDARIGGGFSFPRPEPPCPLEVCQGTPKGAPEEQPPGTSTLRSPGIPVEPHPRKCRKGKRRVRRNGKVRCVKRHRKGDHRRAERNRRAAR